MEAPSSGRKNRPFYGWVIVFCGAVVLGLTHGVVTNCFSLYIIPVSTALGITRDAFSVCNMIVNVLYALVSFFSGFIYSRVPIRRTIKAAAVVLPAGYFCYSFCRNVWQLYLVSVVVGFSLSFITFVAFTIIIGNWFQEKRGTAFGLCFMGSGLGGMVMNSLTAVLLERFGWQRTYQITGAVMLAVLFVLIFFVIRTDPEQMGLRPLGEKQAAEEPVYGPEARTALHSRSFFALAVLAVVIGLDSAIIGQIIAPHLCDLQYPTMLASNVTSVYLGCLAAAKILIGRLYDRIGAIRGTAITMLGFLLGFFGLYLSTHSWAIPLIMLAAVGTAASNVSYPVTTRHAFGTRAYTTLYGYMMGINFVTSSLGVVFANRIYTVTGSYNTVMFICMAASLAGLAALRLIRPARQDG